MITWYLGGIVVSILMPLIFLGIMPLLVNPLLKIFRKIKGD